MWTCGECGCQAIAPGVPFCPQCFTPKEDGMAKVTVEGGYSNAAEDTDELLLTDREAAPEGSQEAPEDVPASDDTPEAPAELQEGSTARKAPRKPGR